MITIESTSQEVIALLNNVELIETLSYLISQCNGKVVLQYDGRKDGCLSDILVYSECFRKKDLNILFNHCAYDEVIFSKKHQLAYVRLEMPL